MSLKNVMGKTLTVIAMMVVFGLALSAAASSVGGSDCEEFDIWMYQLCVIAPQYHFQIKDCNDEAMREWFWLYYFLDGKTPNNAIIETQEYDRRHGQKHG